jgi:hypothetical protein
MSSLGYQKFYSKKRSRKDDLILSSVPAICLDDPQIAEKAHVLYEKYQLLHLQCDQHSSQAMKDRVISMISHYPDIISKSLTVENGNALSSLDEVQTLFRSSSTASSSSQRQSWYVSFILQENEKLLKEFLKSEVYFQAAFFPSNEDHESMLKKKLDHLTSEPHGQIPWQKLIHTDPIWLFFGRNLSSDPFRGRVEHTDSVSHDGTWHRQVSGEKVWYLRPVSESQEWNYGSPRIQYKKRQALRRASSDSDTIVHGEDKVKRLRVYCQANDILIINTRLWWHSTELPNTESAADQLSVSYARDFYLHPHKLGQVMASYHILFSS